MWPDYQLKLKNAEILLLSEYGDRARGPYQDRLRLYIQSKDSSLLAFEGEQCGIVAWVEGIRHDCAMPVKPDELTIKTSEIAWKQKYVQVGLEIACNYRVIDEECLEVNLEFRALKDLASPHFSWGIKVASGLIINNYHWTQSPTQMSYSFEETDVTLWMLNTYEDNRGIKKYSYCQALIAEHPDPESLEFHLRTPPGFAEAMPYPHVLKKGRSARMRCVLAVRKGMFYQHRIANEKVQPLEKHASRYGYGRYIDMAVSQFMDSKKYHSEHKGILYYTAVDGDSDNPRFQDWTEGPGWGGAFDIENAYNVVLYAHQMVPAGSRDKYLTHARTMLDGCLANPKFRIPKGTCYKKPGDMDEALISSYWFPDCIWTAAQADFILRFSEIYNMTKWPDCLAMAKDLGKWVLRHQDADGAIPILWQFPIQYSERILNEWRPEFSICTRTDSKAEVIVDFQPASASFMVVALLSLYKTSSEEVWKKAALRLLEVIADQLEQKLPNFGNGEFDYLVFRAKCMDPTGLAYIIQCLAAGYQETNNSRYLKLLNRYTDTLLAYGVSFDFKETLLRPKNKVTLGEYKADIKLAGGITHGNWRPIYGRKFGGRFNLLMNRNEIGDGLLAAWKATGNKNYKAWLEAYANWQTYFQFLGEVKTSPVKTKGSCPQNHNWTTDQGNWNNDYACTAHKWVGTYLKLIKAGIKG